MATSNPCNDGNLSPADKLVQSTLDILEAGGSAQISVRSVAGQAHVPASAVYYYHGDLEQLLLAAQARALEIVSDWCAAFVAALPVGPLPSAALPSIMATMIDSSARQLRREYFAWREAQLAAERKPAFHAPLRAWETHWETFWSRLLGRFGQAEYGLVTAQLFDGESMLHLLQGDRPQDRACLEEICAGWACWLRGTLAPDMPWQSVMRALVREADETPPPPQGVAATISVAAADLVSRAGAAALTHRAVAAEAGVTPGAVAYNFRTSESLFEAAFHELYRRLTATLPPPMSGRNGGLAVAAYRPGFTELLVATARNERFARFRPHLRYTRGRTGRRYLEAMLGPDAAVSSIDAALYSTLGSGLTRWCIGRTDEACEALEIASGETIATMLKA